MGLFGNTSKPKKQLKEVNINATVSTGKNKKKNTKAEKAKEQVLKYVQDSYIKEISSNIFVDCFQEIC